jgi:hypothetical protein
MQLYDFKNFCLGLKRVSLQLGKKGCHLLKGATSRKMTSLRIELNTNDNWSSIFFKDSKQILRAIYQKNQLFSNFVVV